MGIDPYELKMRRIKRDQLINEIQTYMEEQDSLKNGTGKMGHREIKHAEPPSEKVNSILKRTLDFLKEK